MLYRRYLLGLALCAGGLVAQGPVVFKSDVSLVRVDAQVLDRDHRAVTGLRAEDFVLLENGQPQAIRNFAREELPVDVLLLLDVSGSMRPHVERIASAAHQALRALGPDDRVAIMVFDRATRLRLPFRNSRQDVERELERLLEQETFNGGTDITRGLLDAARYVGREARRGARRAIVILTDDQTERDRDEEAVSRALLNADAVLSALLAPDAMRSGRTGMTWPGGGGGGGPLGGIILGRRGGRSRGPVTMGPHTHSAGTAEIARRSGGDSLRVDDAAALDTTLARIRQRYALHFYLPQGVRPGQEREIEVRLSDAARRRYPEADVRFRRVYLAPGGPAETEVASGESSGLKRRRAVNEDGWRTEPSADPADGGWRRVGETPPAETAPAAEPPKPAPENKGGWRRVKPGEQP